MSNLNKILGSIVLVANLLLPSSVMAQRGCCSWHGGISHCALNGRYMCNDGTYSPSCTCVVYRPVPQIPRTPEAPDTKASFKYTPNSDGKTFDVYMDWTDVKNTGYSIALQNTAGGDPGPLTDTHLSSWTFNNVLPGKYYANMKIGVNNVWSNVIYWEVDVPKWYSPSPSPVPTPVPPPAVRQNNDSPDFGIILVIFGAILVGGMYVGLKLLNWIVKLVKENEWAQQLLLYLVFFAVVAIVAALT